MPSLGKNKVTGVNSVLLKILKLVKERIAENLCFIDNVSLQQVFFRKGLKIAKVTPVYKKSFKLECANYRSISLLSNLDKIVETLMHK